MQMLSPETALSLMQHTQVKDPQLVQSKDKQKMAEVAREFEAVFVAEMMKPMFDGIETDDMFGGGKGEEIFRSMMIQEYGKHIAERDITGIQTQVQSKLIEMQAERTAQNQSTAISKGKIIEADFTEKLGKNEGIAP